MLVNWVNWKFLLYTALSIQRIQETKSQMALLSLGNRSLKNKWLMYICMLEVGTKKNQHQFAVYFWYSANKTPKNPVSL